MRTLIALIGLLILVAGPAEAGFKSGNDLLRDCGLREGQTRNEQVTYGTCLGYRQAVVDTLVAMQKTAAPILGSCDIEGVGTRRLREIFEAYAREHADELHDSATNIVMTAMYEDGLCKLQEPEAPEAAAEGE